MPKRKLPASLATLSQDSKKSKGYQKAIEGMAKAQENDKERNTIRKGDNHWELSNKRRLTVTEYSGKPMVDIREFYEKDGESLPGKKGIMLSTEQFNAIMKALPEVIVALSAKGVEVEIPKLPGAGDAAETSEEEDGDDVEVKGENDKEVERKVDALPTDDESDEGTDES